MRLAYLGTPDVAVAPLVALHDADHDIVAVVTGPDRRRGRGTATSPSPVKAAAIERGLPVTHDLGELSGSDAELGVVVAYGRIIPSQLLDEIPMVNLHFSLLPRWRGAAPVERAILAGDTMTGVCVMDVATRLDEGDVHDRIEVPISDDVTADELRAELAAVGTDLLVRRLDVGLGDASPQVGEPTYAHKLTSDDRRIDWSDSATQAHRVVRVGDAHTTFRGERFKIHRATVATGVDDDDGQSHAPGALVGSVVACGTGALAPVEVQAAGAARMTWESWRHGAQPRLGERLGERAAAS